MAVGVQERTKAVITKAEETIRELEETVQAMPVKSRGMGSGWFVGAALGSIAIAVSLFARKRKEDAMFVGLWAPTFLVLGMFRDILKAKRQD